MDRASAERESAVQRERANSATEIAQLKSSLLSLENLENIKIREEDKLQKATSHLAIQNQALQKTISELRTELENAQISKDEVAQKVSALAQNEISQLKLALSKVKR